MAMMTKTNDGEQEVVIGNKQLLGIFFVVVVLLSIFFTMGYIIGRNTANAGVAQNPAASATLATARQDAPAERVDPASQPTAQEPPPSRPVENPPRTRAAEPYSTRAEGGDAAAAPATETTESRPASALKAIPEGDLYLQVAAIPRADAETERKVLRERGFPTLIGESSKPGLFRVLVGPFKDMSSVHISKDELKKAGFESFVVK